jgi:hypothetical protein
VILAAKTRYKKLVALGLILAFLANSFSGVFVIADYFANYSNYQKNCINKYRPQLHCNGKCILMQKLKQQEKNEQQSPARKLENRTEVLLSSRTFFESAYSPSFRIILNTQSGIYAGPHPNDRSLDIFHPPQA